MMVTFVHLTCLLLYARIIRLGETTASLTTCRPYCPLSFSASPAPLPPLPLSHFPLLHFLFLPFPLSLKNYYNRDKQPETKLAIIKYFLINTTVRGVTSYFKNKPVNAIET